MALNEAVLGSAILSLVLVTSCYYNMPVIIAYDADKNQRNIRERGLSFERAADFDFNTALVDEDVRRNYPERRFVAIGWLSGRVHVLCFTPISGGIRVISFRKANSREVTSYERATAADQ